MNFLKQNYIIFITTLRLILLMHTISLFRNEYLIASIEIENYLYVCMCIYVHMRECVCIQTMIIFTIII